MSTSVCSSTRPLLTSRNQELSMFNQPVRKVKRTLFGPVDHQATQKFIDDELKKIIVNKSEIWNFDFKKEANLHPDGAYDWRPVTPKKQIRLIKRKADSALDNSDQYCHISEVQIVRPKASCLPTHNTIKIQQSLITDFMKTTKRPSSATDFSKKQSTSEWNTEIPNKIPRLDIAS